MPATTTVVGSYTVPDWYPVLQEAVIAKKITAQDFADAKATAARSAIHDQEVAGIDIISDGELFRRDDNRFGPPNAMINFFAAKIQGFAKEPREKSGISPVAPDASLPAPVITGKLGYAPLTLIDELKFLRANSTQKVKIAMTGPHMFARVCWDEHYKDPQAIAMDMAAIINKELRELDTQGCDVIQLDEPILWFLKGDQSWGAEAINTCFNGVKNAKKLLHVCQGNYNPDPSAHKGIRIFPSEFAAILPLIEKSNVDIVHMAAASFGQEHLAVLEDLPKNKIICFGVVDVQDHKVETPDEVARAIEKITSKLGEERVWVAPDCGLNHLPRDIAFAKLKSLASGAKLVLQRTR
jgi:5-methyltetrahydropteroyltriglutamate--homocysteine methyltransferase